MNDTNIETICKVWGKCRGRVSHWAYYSFASMEEMKYWTIEHRDDKHRMYWRHHDFMSIPCARCGAYSPLRAQTSFLGGPLEGDERSCDRGKIKDFHPSLEFPDSLCSWHENGWHYVFFKATLSDSMDGQATFTLKRLPTDEEVESQIRQIPLEIP